MGKIIVAGRKRLDFGRIRFALSRYNVDRTRLRASVATARSGRRSGRTPSRRRCTPGRREDRCRWGYRSDKCIRPRALRSRWHARPHLHCRRDRPGQFRPSHTAFANGVAIQPDGKIVAVGGGEDRARPRDTARTGPLDASLNSDGKVKTDIFRDRFDFEEQATSLFIQLDGKIVAGGQGGTRIKFGLVRYDANGFLDPSFGRKGKVVTDVAPDPDFLTDVALELGTGASPEILAAGASGTRRREVRAHSLQRRRHARLLVWRRWEGSDQLRRRR